MFSSVFKVFVRKMAQRRLEDKQPEEKINTDYLVKEQEKIHHDADVGAVIMKTIVPGQEGAKGNAPERYREDSNEAAFVVAAVKKIYAHESLTFSDTVACEVTKGLLVKAKENILGLKIIRDQSGNPLRVSQSRIHNKKLARNKEIWLKGLSTESKYELRLVAGIATGALIKGYTRSKVPAQVKVVAYRPDDYSGAVRRLLGPWIMLPTKKNRLEGDPRPEPRDPPSDGQVRIL
nr:zinc finger, CCHC-type [Tanacetum cinerariifolium]